MNDDLQFTICFHTENSGLIHQTVNRNSKIINVYYELLKKLKTFYKVTTS